MPSFPLEGSLVTGYSRRAVTAPVTVTEVAPEPRFSAQIPKLRGLETAAAVIEMPDPLKLFAYMPASRSRAPFAPAFMEPFTSIESRPPVPMTETPFLPLVTFPSTRTERPFPATRRSTALPSGEVTSPVATKRKDLAPMPNA